MPIPLYLAMSAAEMGCCRQMPEKTAWMACHFSPSGPGLTNLPPTLSPGSLLILDDSTPIQGHDAAQVCQILANTVEQLKCSGVLLDFERPPTEASLAMAAKIAALPRPVCVAADYAKDLDCPVFLPPVPLLKTVEDYLQPWQGRTVLLEAALSGSNITVTSDGMSEASFWQGPQGPHFDPELCCHYSIAVDQNQAQFRLNRTREDLDLLLARAAEAGVRAAIGLFQEFA